MQEFDLTGPTVVVGRADDCHISIEDPLISRRHAQIDIEGDAAYIHDLGSRNGVQVNGHSISGRRALLDGDRVRLGTQELVFASVKPSDRRARPTGFMKVCRECETPFPESAGSCPHCGHGDLAPEDTLSGGGSAPSRNWTFQLLGEVIERALTSQRMSEADRLLRRAATEVQEQSQAGQPFDPEQLLDLARFGVRLGQLSGQTEWVRWALHLCVDQKLPADEATLTLLHAAPHDDETRSLCEHWAEKVRAADSDDERLFHALQNLSKDEA